MLYANLTRPVDSYEYNILSTVSPTFEEGTPLVAQMDIGGVMAVAPALGASGEIFVGVSWSQVPVATTGIYIDTFIVSTAGGSVSLSRKPVTGTAINAKFGSNPGALTVAGVPAAGQAQFTGPQTITFNSADAGTLVTIQYRYSLSLAQAQEIYGERAGQPAQTYLQSVGVIRRGIVYTDNIDSGTDWSQVGSNIYLGAGIFTGTSGGVKLNSAYIVQVPTPDYPWLGLYYSA